MALSAGALRHRLTIQRRGRMQDPVTGDIISGWIDVGKVWGKITPLSARDFIAAQAGQSKVSARIQIRYRDDIEASMRILHRGKAYIIEGVLPDDDSGLEYLTLPVSEGVRHDG